MERKKPATTQHIGHLIFTLLTGGMWLIIWLFCALITNNQNRKIDEHNRHCEDVERRNFELRQLELLAKLNN